MDMIVGSGIIAKEDVRFLSGPPMTRWGRDRQLKFAIEEPDQLRQYFLVRYRFLLAIVFPDQCFKGSGVLHLEHPRRDAERVIG